MMKEEGDELYKTELCRKWMQVGNCRYGDKCQFAHGTHELRSLVRHPLYKTSNCKSFQSSGTCRYGNRCRFIHDEPEDYLCTLARGVSTMNVSDMPRVPSAPAGLHRDTYQPYGKSFSASAADLSSMDRDFLFQDNVAPLGTEAIPIEKKSPLLSALRRTSDAELKASASAVALSSLESPDITENNRKHFVPQHVFHDSIGRSVSQPVFNYDSSQFLFGGLFPPVHPAPDTSFSTFLNNTDDSNNDESGLFY